MGKEVYFFLFFVGLVINYHKYIALTQLKYSFMCYTNVQFIKVRHDIVCYIRRASQTQTRFVIDDNFNFIVTCKSNCVGSNY
jgi:hypothetical protein